MDLPSRKRTSFTENWVHLSYQSSLNYKLAFQFLADESDSLKPACLYLNGMRFLMYGEECQTLEPIWQQQSLRICSSLNVHDLPLTTATVSHQLTDHDSQVLLWVSSWWQSRSRIIPFRFESISWLPAEGFIGCLHEDCNNISNSLYTHNSSLL